MSLIILKDICKKFGSIEVAKSVGLMVENSDFVSIMGKSGCGKSTLLHMLGMLENADSGEYYFDGIEISNLTTKEKAKIRNIDIGFVFQSFNLEENYNVYENVELPLLLANVVKEKRKVMVKDALIAVGMNEREKEKTAVLSGGEKQRIAIARAIVGNPKLILADEPTGNLDEATGIEIMQLFKKINENGCAIVLVTHDTDCANYANVHYRMKDGVLLLNS